VKLKNPDIYDYHEGLTLNDFCSSGGLTGSASKSKWQMIMSR
jgi:hypothetical protein